MALLIIPPLFNPLDMIVQIPSKALIAADLAAYLQYSTPAAEEQRAEERAARQQEILVQQSGIVNSLQTQCRFDQALISSDPDNDVIFITPFTGVDCSSPSGVLTAVPASGEVYNDLSQEYETLNTDPPYKSISVPTQEQIDQELIPKFSKLLETWTQHVFIASNVIDQFGNFYFGPLYFRPLFLSPPLITETVTTMYRADIKPYNRRHKTHILAQQESFNNYVSPAAKAERLAGRIGRIPELQVQAQEIRNAIAVEETKLAVLQSQISSIPLEDVITISISDQNDPDQIIDKVQFSQPALDFIVRDIDLIRAQIPVVNTSYLSGDLATINDTVNSIENRVLFKTTTIARFNAQIAAATVSLNNIDLSVQAEDRNISALIVDLEGKVADRIVEAGAGLENILLQLVTVNSQLTAPAEMDGLIPNALQSSRKDTFKSEIRNFISSVTQEKTFEEHVTALIDRIRAGYSSDVSGFSAGVNLDNVPLLDLFKRICDDILAVLNGQTASQSGQALSNTKAKITQVEKARTVVVKMGPLYDPVAGIKKALLSLVTAVSDLKAGIAAFDILTDSPDPLNAAYNSLFSEYMSLRSRVNADAVNSVISVSPANQSLIQGAVSQAQIEQKKVHDILIVTNNEILQQQAKRQTLRNDKINELNTTLNTATAGLADITTNTVNDTQKIHSYRVIEANAVRLQQVRDAVVTAVDTEKARVALLRIRLEEKQSELDSFGGDVIFVSQIGALQAEIETIRRSILLSSVPDITILITSVNDFADWLLNSLSKTLSDLKSLLNSVNDQIEHPEIDPPFVFFDPFDETFNACHAIVLHFMNHMVKYMAGFFFLPVSNFAVPLLTVTTFSPIALSESAVSATAKDIADMIKASGPVSDVITAILNFVLNNLIKKLDQHLIKYAQIVGTNTYFFPPPVGVVPLPVGAQIF